MNGLGLRHVILLAAIALTSRWEVAYGHRLQLGVLAWALPLLTSGYLWLAMSRRSRLDVGAAVSVVTVSAVLGSVSSVVTLPPVALAVWTALLVAGVLYRTHVIDDLVDVDQDDDPEPVDLVAEPVARPVAPVARPVAVEAAPVDVDQDDDVVDDRPTAANLDDAELVELMRRREAAGDPMTFAEVHEIRAGTYEADRSWYRRRTAERTSR